MKTDDFTRLIPPQPAQVNIDPTPKDCPSEGFNYPTFRLLNKQERVKLSAKRFEPDPSTFYNHLAVANSKGWFAAVTVLDDGSYALICSPLVDLRVAYKNAKDSESVYTPKRKLPLQSQKPNIIALASNDTRLFMSLESGDLLVYDTAILFSAGSDAVSPMHVLPPDTGPIRYIVPNPGTESNVVDLVAVVRSNMTVVLYNSTLEVQGGWIAPDGDLASAPVAAAWSPKGKHIAIGLQSGHILTYPLTNKSSINKHIPPTAQPPLVALEWLSPGHTFRTSYAPSSGTTDPKQHIICVDVKSSTATYYAPSYPFPLPDRNNQPFAVVLPKWDEDPGANEPRSLVVVGDKASVDVEVLGNTGTQWYQQSQENPLSLPLDSNLEDTMLFDLEVDLTDVDTSTPILYAYLNDGTMQGWYMEHTKPYPGMVNPQPVPAPTPTAAPVAFGQPAPAPSTTVTPPAQQTTFGQAAFGQTTTPSAFGQPSFGQPTALGQPQKTPTFGTPGFGQAAPTGGKVLFGQTSSPSAFSGGAAASPFGQSASTSAFGTPSGAFGGGAFGAAAPTSTFGSTAFGSTTSTTNTFGSGAFGGFANANGDKNAFGQASFGFGSSTPSPAAAPAPAPAEMTREASMSDDTPSLGGMSLGESRDTSKETKSGGIFGSFPSATSSTTTTSTFGGGAIKPATGFGAFGDTATFGQSAFSKPAAPAFGSTTTPTGGFAAFASSTPSAFGSATTTQASATASTPATGGAFGAFAAGSPSPFGATASQSTTTTSPFTAASTQPKSPFAPSGGAAPAFGAPAFGVSPFGAQPGARARSPSEREKDESPPATAKMPSKPTAFAPSPMSSPESTPRLGKATIVGDEESPPPPPAFKTTTTPATSPFGTVTAPASGAFGNIQTSPSVFKPATGFGAFGSDKAPASSPFFKAPTEPKTPPVTVFASALASPPSITPQAATTASPMFGAASSLGAARPVFTPAAPAPTLVKAPATGGFGAFSGTSTGFAAFGGPKKSFGELLKTADVDTTDPVKPKTGAVLEAPKDVEKKPVSAFPSITKPSSVFTPPEEVVEKKKEEPEKKEEAEKKEEPSALPAREKAKEKEDVVTEELSFGNLSLLSNASSFAEVEVEEPEEEKVRSASEDEEGEAQLEYEEEEPFLSEEGEEELLSSEESSQLSDVPEEEEEEEAEEEQKAEAESREPTAVPLPVSRSPSATPQPEAPKITVTPSPPPEVALSTVVEESTTPPGTPTKEPVAPVPRAPSAALPATAHTPSFGLGLGRPSTRPTRSSPLAGVPVSLAAEEEPSPVKPPVSPKPRVAPLPQEVVPLKGEDEEEKAAGAKPARPKTPPLLSAFGPKKTEAPSPVLAPTAPPPTTPATPASNLFGQFKLPTPGTPTETPPGKTTPPPSGFSLFGAAAQPPAFDFSGLGAKPKPFAPTSPPHAAAPAQPSPATAGTLLFGPSQVPTTVGGAFGMQGKETQATTEAAKAPSFDLSGFGLKGKAAPAPAEAAAPATPPPFDLSGFSLKGKAAGAPAPAPAPQPPALQVPTEAGMQRECVLLVNHVNEDLASLARLAEQHKKHLEQLRARAGGRQRQDLFDAKKWSPATAAQFGGVMVQFEKDLDELKDVRDGQREILREIQASMLKAGTRKEEISRFNKAKSDKEFARMLKSRTLGPEHLETQTQLRRNIRTMRDRIQKLEDHLKASKKKLTQVKTGQPGLRAPSLDTINRTYRNIDLAIQHQSAEVAQLKKRMARLQLSARSSSASASPTPSPPRDPRLPDPIARPYNVTPHVAVTTAAALNAERSASKLKRALLATRKEPLLNTRAKAAAPPPLSFGTPQKQEQPSPSPFNFSTPTPKAALEDTATPKPGVPSTPDWGIVLPADNHHHHHHYSPSPSPSPTLARRGAGAGVKRHSVVPLRKGGTGSPGGAEVGKGFDWGPLPTFNRGTPGSFTMVEAVRLTPPKQGQGQGQGQEGK